MLLANDMRRISDAIYARLLADARRAGQRPASRAREATRERL